MELVLFVGACGAIFLYVGVLVYLFLHSHLFLSFCSLSRIRQRGYCIVDCISHLLFMLPRVPVAVSLLCLSFFHNLRAMNLKANLRDWRRFGTRGSCYCITF